MPNEKAFLLFLYVVLMTSANRQQTYQTNILSKAILRDKIMGGWEGQTIGVPFSAPKRYIDGVLAVNY